MISMKPPASAGVVVGSSKGGAIAMNINSRSTKLILHSPADDVVLFADSGESEKNSGATLIEVGTDHRLVAPEPLAALRRACEGKL